MVGIAGVSKGCRTCKRRKIGCDMRKPTCYNCARSAKVCEGYDTRPILINRSAKDFTKDETPIDSVARVPHRECAPIVEQRSIPGATAPSSHVHSAHLARPYPTNPSQLIGWNPNGPLQQGIESSWLDIFLPTDTRNGTSTVAVWAYSCVAITHRTEALNDALTALAATRVGQTVGDQNMVLHGLAANTRALGSLQKALWDSELVLRDETLAACLLLMKFELEQSTSRSLIGFVSHVIGLLQLLELRGSERNATPLTKAIMSEVRYAALVNALPFRRHSPLSDPKWRIDDWIFATDVEQSLMYIGLQLVDSLEQYDNLQRTAQPEQYEHIATYCLAAVMRVETSLGAWYAQVQGTTNLAFPWSSSMPHFGHPMVRKSGWTAPNINIDRLQQVILMLHYWLFSLVAKKEFMRLIKYKQPESVLTSAINEHDQEAQLQLIENITDLAPQLSSPENGITPATRTILPIRMSLFIARSIGCSRALALVAKCEQLLASLVKEKGVQHAQMVLRSRGNEVQGLLK